MVRGDMMRKSKEEIRAEVKAIFDPSIPNEDKPKASTSAKIGMVLGIITYGLFLLGKYLIIGFVIGFGIHLAFGIF